MLSVSVPASKAEGKPVMYVVCTVAAGQRWVVERRFSAFLTLHEELEGIDPAFTERAVLPPKSWFVSDAMVEARRVLFHKYLEDALESPTISRHPRLLAFLGLTAADMDGLRTSAPSVGSLGDGDGSPVEEDVRTKKPAAAAPKRPAGRSKVAHASPELTSAREQELQAALAAEVSKRSALERQIRAMERTHAAELERAEQAKADAKAAALKEVQERAREARERRLLHEQLMDIRGTTRVFCRVRPLHVLGGRVGKQGETSCLTLCDDNTSLQVARAASSMNTFQFDRVFAPDSTQASVFAEVDPLVTSVIDGYNVCIFAYGQTGSGKTFTMDGPSGSEGTDATLGLNYRCLRRMFEEVRRREARGGISVHASVSVVEVYNDKVYDLLEGMVLPPSLAGSLNGSTMSPATPASSKKASPGHSATGSSSGKTPRTLGIDDSERMSDLDSASVETGTLRSTDSGVNVGSLQSSSTRGGRKTGARKPPFKVEAVLKSPSPSFSTPRSASFGGPSGMRREHLTLRTNQDGDVVPTGLTYHTVTTFDDVCVLLERGKRARATGQHALNHNSSRSHLVLSVVITVHSELEDSDVVSRLTLVDLAGSERVAKTASTGPMLAEAKSINTTLSALGNVMEALARKATHIPYRESKLTHLLHHSFGGQSKLLMFVNVSPSSLDAQETIYSLNFAMRCMEVGTRKQTDVQTRELFRLQRLVAEQEEELYRLRAALGSGDGAIAADGEASLVEEEVEDE